MSSFLELWGGQKHKISPIDPAYLAIGYNREVGSGSEGTRMVWLAYVVAKYGAIPQGATFAERSQAISWPLPNWRDNHNKLLPEKDADEILSRRFTHGSMSDSFTGAEYVDDEVHIDFRRFRYFVTTHRETYVKSDEPETPATFRTAEKKDREKIMEEALTKWGLETELTAADPDKMYLYTKAQLEAERPVLISLNPDLAEKDFGTYGTLGSADLLPEGKGKDSTHAMVVVAHCDKQETEDKVCSKFAQGMRARNISECLVLQNSWGEHNNQKGYVCVSRKALARMIYRVSVLDTYAK